MRRDYAVSLLKRIVDEGTRNWLPPWLPNALMAAQAAGSDRALMLDSYAGHLQVMESPLFQPRFVGAFQFDGIGSGGNAAKDGFATYTNMIFGGGGLEGLIFDRAVQSFIEGAGITTVGGLRPTYEISAAGVQAISIRGSALALESRPDGTWVQRNLKDRS